MLATLHRKDTGDMLPDENLTLILISCIMVRVGVLLDFWFFAVYMNTIIPKVNCR